MHKRRKMVFLWFMCLLWPLKLLPIFFLQPSAFKFSRANQLRFSFFTTMVWVATISWPTLSIVGQALVEPPDLLITPSP